MGSVWWRVWGVIRTFCRTGWPEPPVVRLLLSDAAVPEAFASGVGVAPKPDAPLAPMPVPVAERDPKPLDDEPLLLLFRDSRSALDAEEKPDPGAIWPLAESSEAEHDPPITMSARTAALCRHPPNFTR